MKSQRLNLQIQRFNPERQPSSWMETFQLEPRGKMNLLEALLRIQDEQDGSLAFRYSCRGAVCGSCAMGVNGKVVLACRTPVEGLLGRPVLIEPLPHFPVIRDLIVDMSSFFARYREIEPFLHSKEVPGPRETLMDEGRRKEIDPYINCILCGICFGSCPAFKLDLSFLGPAMLAKAFRFFLDPRDGRGDKILESVNSSKVGVWACKTVFNCVTVCPKDVPPTRAIVQMRSNILRSRLRSLCLRLKRNVPFWKE
jgi:succinate dehydrogenase / fumarate reductase iron-sulfur subunit